MTAQAKSLYRYIPSGSIMVACNEELGIQVFADEARLSAIGYSARRTKHDFFIRFGKKERMDKYIADYVNGIVQKDQDKKTYRAEKAAAGKAANVVVGDIFRSCWGYEQTNVDYYEVVAVRGMMVDVRKIGALSEDTGGMSGECVPRPGSFVGEVITKKVQAYKGSEPYIKMTSYSSATRLQPVAVIGGVKMYSATYWSAYA